MNTLNSRIKKLAPFILAGLSVLVFSPHSKNKPPTIAWINHIAPLSQLNIRKMRQMVDIKEFRELFNISRRKLGRLLRPKRPFDRKTIIDWEDGITPITKEVRAALKNLYKKMGSKELQAIKSSLSLPLERFCELLAPENPISNAILENWLRGVTPIPPNFIIKAREVYREESPLRLRSIRLALELSQGELAPLIKSDKQAISKWEKKIRYFGDIPIKKLSIANKIYTYRAPGRFKALWRARRLTAGEFGRLLGPEAPFSASIIYKWGDPASGRLVPVEILLQASIIVEGSGRLRRGYRELQEAL